MEKAKDFQLTNPLTSISKHISLHNFYVFIRLSVYCIYLVCHCTHKDYYISFRTKNILQCIKIVTHESAERFNAKIVYFFKNNFYFLFTAIFKLETLYYSLYYLRALRVRKNHIMHLPCIILNNWILGFASALNK